MDVTAIRQSDIFVFGLRIQEPVTSGTDLIIAAMCFWFFYQLNKRNDGQQTSFLMKYHFLFLGFATLSGGLFGHAFLYLVNDWWKLPGWYMSMISIMFIERAAIEHSAKVFKPKLIKSLLILNVVELVVIAVLTGITIEFKYVQFHSFYGLVCIVFPFHLYVYSKTKNLGSKWTLAGILVMMLGAPAFNIPIIIHEFFNHKDLSHVIIMASIYCLYRGTLNLNAKGASSEQLSKA
jgi:hypothetical protein